MLSPVYAPRPFQVIVNHRNLNCLYDRPESPGIWLYVSSSNGGMKITSVIIEGKEAVLADGLYKAGG